MMKTFLQDKKGLISTTPVSDLLTKENNYLFNSVDNLAVDHDVKVSNTMIKVTYKKTLKDQNFSHFTNNIDFSQDSLLEKNNMNSATKKRDKILANGHTVFSNKISSTPKDITLSVPPESSSSKKKSQYINGLHLSDMDLIDDANNEGDFVSHSRPKVFKKLKISREGKFQSIRFLKNVNVEKVKDSISKDLESEKNNSKGLKTKIVINKNFKAQNDIEITTNDMNSKTVKRKMSSEKSGSGSRNKKVKPNEEKKVEEYNKKPLLEVDPDLPSGWTRYIHTKNKGCFDEKHIVYVVSPQGKKFRLKWKLRKYLEKTHSTLDPDQFFFGLYKRTKPFTHVPAGNEGKIREGSQEGMNEAEYKSTPEITKSKPTSSNLIQNDSSNEGKPDTYQESSIDNKIRKTASANSRELLLHDPDLPFGWKRIIKSSNSSGKLQVLIISPEGRIFRRRYRLHEYLTKHQCTHNLDRFYFGLYPKKDNIDGSKAFPDDEEDENSSDGNSEDDINEPNVIIEEKNMSTPVSNVSAGTKQITSGKEISKYSSEVSPMYHDPNLPKGWKREVRVRTFGESAGRMEVIIISPDSRRFRTKKHLEHYFQRHNLNHNAEEFDFSLFGKRRHTISEPKDVNSDFKRRFKKPYTKPVPDLDFSKLKKIKSTPEGEMITAVSGLMIACDLSSLRSERRSLLPKKEQEQILRNLESVGDKSSDSSDIPAHWVQRLVNCRSEFKPLEPEAVGAIAEKTKNFLKEICHQAFENSKHPEEGLRYEDLAEFVENSKSLLPFRNLIPKKITYKEYIRLNRPKQYLSFT